MLQKFLSNIFDVPKKSLDPFFPVFSHFFMSYFDVFGSILDICAMTDFLNVIVLIRLVSYNFCMIPHVLTLTFGLNLSGAWGVLRPKDSQKEAATMRSFKYLR